MSEKTLQRTFVWGTLFFLAVLVGMTTDSLRQVLSGRTPPVTDQVARGKQIFQRRNCNDCHTILGIGGYFAPELTKVAERRDTAWIRAFLSNPQATKPGTTMPNQQLAAIDVGSLVAFFQWVRRIDTNGWPPKPWTALDTSAVGSAPGALQTKGCLGCHTIDGRGTVGIGPNLSHIGGVPYDALPNTPDFLSRWLANPPAMKPGTLMPKLPLNDAERDSLVKFLEAHK